MRSLLFATISLSTIIAAPLSSAAAESAFCAAIEAKGLQTQRVDCERTLSNWLDAYVKRRIPHDLSSPVADIEQNASNVTVLGQNCIAANALATTTGEGVNRDELVTAIRGYADRLIAIDELSHDGRIGWTYDPKGNAASCQGPGTLKSLDGELCNPRLTKYTWQTGLALTCLARTFKLTHDEKYGEVLRSAISASWPAGNVPKRCSSCFYYWYSYSPHDAAYVRNTNALMGMALAWAWRATGDTSYRQRAQAVANSEKREFATGNEGYFGIDSAQYGKQPVTHVRDSLFGAQYVENHATTVIKADFDLSMLLGDSVLLRDTEAYWQAWNSCNNRRCLDQLKSPNGCSVWGAPIKCQNGYTFAPCILAKVSQNAAKICGAVIEYAVTKKHTDLIEGNAMWAIFDNTTEN
jgi:hypothetical protein